MKKVIFFLPGDFGGAEKIAITIAKSLPLNQYKVKFVFLCNHVGNIREYIPEQYETKHIRIKNLWDFTPIRILLYLKKEKPYAVYGPMCFLNPHVILGAYGANKRIKIIVRNDNFVGYFGFIKRLLLRLTYPLATIIIAQQEEMKQDIVEHLHISKKKVSVLYNPIEKDFIDACIKAPSPYDEKDLSIKFVQVGRVHPDKGQDILLKAFRLLHSENPNSKLYIIGRFNSNDKYYQDLIRYLSNHHLAKNVYFIGFDKNPYRWIKNADCFVLSSRREGLPNALLEAMYIGVPVVATKCIPIIERIVKNNYNGILIEPNDINTMANAMKRAYCLQNFRMTYTAASQQNIINIFS